MMQARRPRGSRRHAETAQPESPALEGEPSSIMLPNFKLTRY